MKIAALGRNMAAIQAGAAAVPRQRYRALSETIAPALFGLV
jgi:hypothetical protein